MAAAGVARSGLPPERLTGALVIGFRHARYNASLRATLIRAVAFFFFASAYWALLPLVARNQIAGGPELYGILLGAIGIGAVVGAFTLPSMKAALGSDRLVAAGTLGTALSLVLLGIARHSAIGIAACAGRGRFMDRRSRDPQRLGSDVPAGLGAWPRPGHVCHRVLRRDDGRQRALGAACLGARFAGGALHRRAPAALVGIAATWHWKLLSGAGVDLAPSMHWPAPVLAIDADADRGPVLVTVEYRVAPEKRDAFLVAVRDLGPTAPAGRRLRLGRLRGCRRERALPRDLHGQLPGLSISGSTIV